MGENIGCVMGRLLKVEVFFSMLLFFLKLLLLIFDVVGIGSVESGRSSFNHPSCPLHHEGDPAR